MSEQTDLTLPSGLQYPVTIRKLLVSAGDTIKRGTELLWYSYKYGPETRYGTWDSYVEGTVNLWNVEVGDEVPKDYGPVLVVTEPCKHGIQIAGMCANCGKDMTEVDYMSNAALGRAEIRMDHSGDGPLMSVEEAAKIERENTRHLLGQRKLSLIVDLDQTILHATVDPTVGEWLRAKKTSESEDGSTTPPVESANFPALEDVAKFQLADDMGHGVSHPSSLTYYIKPRPGLTRFMSKISKLYEMHVYTMGTRTYANAVCAALDPSGKWFGHRVLTRSESGSDRYKSLQRLFPSDQSMVVIIDDRADVWGNSPNLVRVIAFEFFVGTGDINSTTLPKETPAKPVEEPKSTTVQSSSSSTDGGIGEISQPTEPTTDAVDISENEDSHAEYVHRTQAERPLAKALERQPAKDGSDLVTEESLEHRIRKAILNDDDRELERVEAILCEVHDRFYRMYDAYIKARSNPIPDVARIIPARKTKTFNGLHFVFSSLIPLSEIPEQAPIWKAAISYGATCHRDINSKVTHLIAAKPGTQKIEKAFEMGTVKVVNLQWFNDSIARWERQPEQKYLLEYPQSRAPSRMRQPVQPEKDTNGASSQEPKFDSKVNGETKKAEEQVSAPDGTAEKGSNPLPSALESTEATETNGSNPVEGGVYFPAAKLEPPEPEVEMTELHIDWAELDKELEDELGSVGEDDEDDATSTRSCEADEGQSREPDNSMVTSRGVKRRRSGDSAPSTPSKLRFSTTADDLDVEEQKSSPYSKRRRIEDITSTIRDDTSPSKGDATSVSIEEDDDDDFLAREMADGDADEWDDDEEGSEG